MDWEATIEMILAGLLAIGMFVLHAIIILLCGYAVSYLFDWLNFTIDTTLYWTGVALLILFCIFGKTEIKEVKE